MRISGKITARSFYVASFALSIVYFLRLLWSLLTDNDKEWEYFFSSVVLFFIGLIILGATDPKK